MFGWLKNLAARPTIGKPYSRSFFARIRAKFDSAQTTADNRRHWANADGLSADAAASPEVRRILRNRARYEVANNASSLFTVGRPPGARLPAGLPGGRPRVVERR